MKICITDKGHYLAEYLILDIILDIIKIVVDYLKVVHYINRGCHLRNGIAFDEKFIKNNSTYVCVNISCYKK